MEQYRIILRCTSLSVARLETLIGWWRINCPWAARWKHRRRDVRLNLCLIPFIASDPKSGSHESGVACRSERLSPATSTSDDESCVTIPPNFHWTCGAPESCGWISYHCPISRSTRDQTANPTMDQTRQIGLFWNCVPQEWSACTERIPSLRPIVEQLCTFLH